MAIQPAEHASSEEAAEALAGLSEPDKSRLGRIARLRANGLVTMDADDLLNEAAKCLLAGTRPWPRDVPFVAFMARNIRGIAHDERTSAHQRHELRESSLTSANDETPASLDDIGANRIDPAREESARSDLDYIEALFDGDAHALKIIEGLKEGWTATEIQAKGKMTKVDYASAKRRIRRVIARAFSGKEI